MMMVMMTMLIKINEERPDCGSTKVESDCLCSGKDLMMIMTIVIITNVDGDDNDDNENVDKNQ